MRSALCVLHKPYTCSKSPCNCRIKEILAPTCSAGRSLRSPFRIHAPYLLLCSRTRTYASSAVADPGPERALRSAASATQARMCARCVLRAATTLGGSSGWLNMRSRWCAPSGISTATTLSDRFLSTPPPCLHHGAAFASGFPCHHQIPYLFHPSARVPSNKLRTTMLVHQGSSRPPANFALTPGVQQAAGELLYQNPRSRPRAQEA